MSTANYSLEEMDRQSLFHPATSIADHLENGPTIIAGGSGVRVKDQQGRDLIDCGAGLWCVNIGYGRAELGEAAAKAMRDLGYYHIFGSHSNEPIIRLADRVLAPVPREGGRRASVEGVLRHLGLRRQRHQFQAGALLQQPAAAGRRRRRSSPGSAPITA